MKRSTSWIAVLPSLVIPVCLGLSMYLGLSYLIKEGTISNELVLRYLTGHPVSEVTVAMFFIGIASLAMIGKNVFDQFAGSKQVTIKSGLKAADAEAESLEATEDNDVGDRAIRLGKRLLDLPKHMHEHYLWQRLVNSLHSIYRTNSTGGVEEELKYLADMDLDRQEQRYSLVRILIWATPMLGFLGTVLGISQALGGINVGPDNNFQDMMNGLRSSLYIAFDTTALALTLSMVLMFCQFLVDRFESQLLILVHQRSKSEISSQFDMTVKMQGESAFQEVAEELLSVSRESVEKQTETWRQTIRAAEQAWTASLTDVNQQVQTNLSDALDENVSNLAHYLGEAIEKADLAMSHRWEQWQVTLSNNAQLMSKYQQELAEQTVSIKQLLDQSVAKERFEMAISRSHDAMAETEKLRQALDAMATSVDQVDPEGDIQNDSQAATNGIRLFATDDQTLSPNNELASTAKVKPRLDVAFSADQIRFQSKPGDLKGPVSSKARSTRASKAVDSRERPNQASRKHSDVILPVRGRGPSKVTPRKAA